MRLAYAAFSMLLAAPAAAQSPLAGIKEDRLHRQRAPDSSMMGGVEPGEDLPEYLASCEAGRLLPAKKYQADYVFSTKDKQVLGRIMQASKKYMDIQAAFRDGYLPYDRGYDDGFGVALLHPQLVRDRTFNLDRPDALSYIKRRDGQEFMLAGVVYIGGPKRPPRIMEFGKQSRRSDADGLARTTTWDFEDSVCVMTGSKRVATYFGEDIPDECAGGAFYEKMWRLYAWPLVYNPQGLFHEYNPVVDFLDYRQKLQPYCPRGGRSR